MSGRKFSEYYEKLERSVQEWYRVILDLVAVDLDDPYTFDSSQGETVFMPEVEYPYIYIYILYILNTPSPYTKEELNVYKSLDGYKYLVAGWVGNMFVHAVAPDNSKMILTASVRSVIAPPLKPWVAAEKCGTNQCAHCTSMAGLGEACSHIAALLFSAEAHTKYIKSCTSDSCMWFPLSLQNVNFGYKFFCTQY